MLQHYAPYLEWIDHQKRRMVELLTAWSHINSHASNINGLKQQLEAIREQLGALECDVQEQPLQPYTQVDGLGNPVSMPLGSALIATKRPHADIQLLFVGHMDTVYHPTSPFQKTELTDSNTLRGPGVADMKGGLLVLLTALKALEKSPYASFGWEILITPDEEIGSPGSHALLEKAARRHKLGLVFEPAFADGSLVSERGGSHNLTLVVRGRKAHAGRDFHLGRSAVYAIAPLIAELEALNSNELIINVGELTAGHGHNIVPDLAIAKINIRSSAPVLLRTAREKLEALVRKYSQREGIQMELHENTTRPPKLLDEPTQHIYNTLFECGTLLGTPLTTHKTHGASDGNLLASFGLPTLDSLGVIGGNLHTEQEYVALDSLVARAKLTALLLMRIGNGECPIHPSTHPIAL